MKLKANTKMQNSKFKFEIWIDRKISNSDHVGNNTWAIKSYVKSNTKNSIILAN